MGGSKGGFILPFASAKVIKTAVFVDRLLCLVKLRGLYDSNFGKNTILEKHKIHDRRASILNFLGKLQKRGSLLTKL